MFRVYGKLVSDKRFQPMDLGEARFVGNLIYATLVPENEHEKLKGIVARLNRENPDYVFEIRKV